MNILVIGNGFDLAHDLPTKYTDFLLFSKIVLSIIEKSHIGYLIPKDDKGYKNWVKKDDEIPLVDGDAINLIGIALRSNGISNRDKEICKMMIYDYFLFNFSKENNNQMIVKELSYLIYNNNWVEYFLQCDMHGKENWIDFESEISEVIESIDVGMDNGLSPRKLSSKIIRLENEFFNNKFTNNVPEYLQAKTVEEQEKVKKPEISYKELRDILLADLNKLIRAFEIYLEEYVEKIDIKVISPDIEEIAAVSYDEHGEKGILFSKVISFNYTSVYEKMYLDKHDIAVDGYMDYIHGKADIGNTIESNNMVLGIDEYLPKKRRNKETEFIAFKKFYQRIHKETGCKYKEWVDKIKESGKKEEKDLRGQFPTQIPIMKFRYKHKLYIFGHSLDVTDKDILRDLILNDNVKTTIFYHSKDAMGQQIANLVKIIGQKELIRRTGGSTKTIYFEPQKPMVPIEKQ